MPARLPAWALLAASCLVACGGPGSEDEFASDAEESSSTSVVALSDAQLAPAIVHLVSGAKHAVDVVAYEYVYTDAAVRPINDALKAAVQRGVKVRVLVDDQVSDSVRSLPLLRGIGVDARADTPAVTTHNKLVLVDGTAFIAGSTNLSSTSLTKNHETDVEVHLSGPAAALKAYYDHLWNAPAQPATVAATGQGRTALVLGDAQYADQAKALIAAARSHVELVMYQGGYSPIARPGNLRNSMAEALVAAAKRGVKVRVVLDRGATGPSGDNAALAQKLTAGGVQVRWDPASLITHAKLLVADDACITGSTNWTQSALADYHATDVLVRKASVSQAFVTYFAGVWAQATP